MIGIYRNCDHKCTRILPVMVNYLLSLAEMIQAGGYDRIEPLITNERFPVQGSGQHEVKIVLFSFNEHGSYASSQKELLEEIDSHGLRPAKIEELLSIGAAYPDLQRKANIVALGATVESADEERFAPALWEDIINDRRELVLFRIPGAFDDLWLRDNIYACVSKN